MACNDLGLKSIAGLRWIAMEIDKQFGSVDVSGEVVKKGKNTRCNTKHKIE